MNLIKIMRIVKNLGGPSKFKVVGLLYEATSVKTSPIETGSEAWWPGKTWGQQQFKVEKQTDK